jgi:outer membrane protein assembly factor BamE (lipoprotein component of BamABCDE complex)
MARSKTPIAYDIDHTLHNRIPLSRRRALVALCIATLSYACTPARDYRGFRPQEGTLEQISIGMSRMRVEEILGTPSAKSSHATPRYYYISSVFETTAFFKPEETERKVYALEFNGTEQVIRVAYYGLQDGKVFDFITKTTPTRGTELSIIQDLLGSISAKGNDK